jgi:hypothetical protein
MEQVVAFGGMPVVLVGAVEAALTALLDKHADMAKAAAPLKDVLGTFFKACAERGEYPVIFIDEANEAFAAGAADEEAKARVKRVLNLFTLITKQEGQASVVLATSEHGFPSRLQQLGYTVEHIQKTIVVEEVPPAAMRELLVARWGCGEQLAYALMSLYGGHVYYVALAVRELAAQRERFKGAQALGMMARAPAACLSNRAFLAAGVPAAEWPQTRASVTAMLEKLVQRGWVPLAMEEDKSAGIISHANAGSVISEAAIAAGVPPQAWATRLANGRLPKFVLVPSSHIMRLLLADELVPPPRRAAVRRHPLCVLWHRQRDAMWSVDSSRHRHLRVLGSSWRSRTRRSLGALGDGQMAAKVAVVAQFWQQGPYGARGSSTAAVSRRRWTGQPPGRCHICVQWRYRIWVQSVASVACFAVSSPAGPRVLSTATSCVRDRLIKQLLVGSGHSSSGGG